MCRNFENDITLFLTERFSLLNYLRIEKIDFLMKCENFDDIAQSFRMQPNKKFISEFIVLRMSFKVKESSFLEDVELLKKLLESALVNRLGRHDFK